MPARVARLIVPMPRGPSAKLSLIPAFDSSSHRQMKVCGSASSMVGRGAANSCHSPA